MVVDEKLANKIKFNKHKKRKNNDLVAGMYAMYQVPNSLEQVAKVYRRTRQAVYDVFKSRGYKLRSKELRGLVIEDGIGFTLMKGGYLRGTVPGKGRMTMQRYVWERERGPVPQGFVIYHLDGNKTNNAIFNLDIVSFVKMQSVFNPKGINQYTKGRV